MTTPGTKKPLNNLFILIALAVVFCLVPLVTQEAYFLHICILALLFGALASSWNLINGYAGIFTFGHQAFFGLGAYGSALMSMKLGFSPWLTMWAAGLMSAALGLVISLPVLRIRSIPHIAIVTLAFAEIVRIVCSNLTDFTRGELGLWGIPPFTSFSLPLVGDVTFDAAHKVAYFYVVILLWLLIVGATYWILRNRFGFGLRAIRDSQIAAESLGVHLTRYKTVVFGFSSFLAGILGAFYAHYVLILTPSSALGIDIMIQIVAMTLIGGIGRLLGPTIGAFILTFGLEWLRGFGEYRMLIYGVLLVLIVMFLPKGLASMRLGFLRTQATKKLPT
jgi:branched-chain amino acid transport system permease protein